MKNVRFRKVIKNSTFMECAECGGDVYIVNPKDKCPHCGATIKTDYCLAYFPIENPVNAERITREGLWAPGA